jgi:hypothetical protein
MLFENTWDGLQCSIIERYDATDAWKWIPQTKRQRFSVKLTKREDLQTKHFSLVPVKNTYLLEYDQLLASVQLGNTPDVLRLREASDLRVNVEIPGDIEIPQDVAFEMKPRNDLPYFGPDVLERLESSWTCRDLYAKCFGTAVRLGLRALLINCSLP